MKYAHVFTRIMKTNQTLPSKHLDSLLQTIFDNSLMRYDPYDHLCYLRLVFFMLSRLFIAALWSPAGKALTSRLLFVMFNCVFVFLSLSHVVSWVRCGT